MTPYLSVIIPAFNEVDRIGHAIESINEYLKKAGHSYEIIVVDDGSKDGTRDLIKNLQHTVNNLEVIGFPSNRGKGAAVKAGMLSAKGAVRLFMDADGSTGIVEIDKLIPFIEEGYEMVIGSRLIKGAVKKVRQSPLREFLGLVYRALVHILIRTDVLDTQNGFKLFSAKAAIDIFNRLQTRGWSFDVEVLVLAKQIGFSIKEVPIVWKNNTQSKMNFLQMPRMLIDLITIYIRYER